MGVAFLILLAIGALLAYPGEPLAWGFAAFIFLGAAGLIYGKWHEFSARQAMIDMNNRDKHR